MYIDKMVVDDWSGTVNGERVILAPELQQVADAVAALDGARQTLVTLLRGAGDEHMSIGGGPERFVVYLTEDNLNFHNLVAADESEHETIALVAGGQLGDYPARQCVRAEHALRAAATYAELGELDAALDWERQ